MFYCINNYLNLSTWLLKILTISIDEFWNVYSDLRLSVKKSQK